MEKNVKTINHRAKKDLKIIEIVLLHVFMCVWISVNHPCGLFESWQLIWILIFQYPTSPPQFILGYTSGESSKKAIKFALLGSAGFQAKCWAKARAKIISQADFPCFAAIFLKVHKKTPGAFLLGWNFVTIWEVFWTKNMTSWKIIYTWNPKQPFINGCFNWMIPNLYIENGWNSPNIHL